LHVVVADYQLGQTGLDVVGMTMERIVTMLASEHAKTTMPHLEPTLRDRSGNRGGGAGGGGGGGGSGLEHRHSTDDAAASLSQLVPPPTVDLVGATHRQGLSSTVVSVQDLAHVSTLQAREYDCIAHLPLRNSIGAISSTERLMVLFFFSFPNHLPKNIFFRAIGKPLGLQ
jgi:hypothetical protein